jgi:hypothetical protein
MQAANTPTEYFFAWLILRSEDGGSNFLRNVGLPTGLHGITSQKSKRLAYISRSRL